MNLLVRRAALPRQSRRPRGRRAQQGMALIVSLVFLMLLSMLGLSSMQNTTMQERMAGNQRDRLMAFEAAEAALREAERQVDAGNASVLDDTRWQASAPRYTGEHSLASDARLAREPQYHVYDLGVVGYVNDQGCERVYRAFHITATGYGGTPNSRVDLETRYINDISDNCE